MCVIRLSTADIMDFLRCDGNCTRLEVATGSASAVLGAIRTSKRGPNSIETMSLSAIVHPPDGKDLSTCREALAEPVALVLGLFVVVIHASAQINVVAKQSSLATR